MMMQHLLATLLLSSLAAAQVNNVPWTGSWSFGGPTQVAVCAGSPNNKVLKATGLQQVPQIGTTVQITSDRQPVPPCSSPVFITIGASRVDMTIPSSVTNSLPVLQVPADDDTRLAAPLPPPNQNLDGVDLVIPNDPSLIGTTLWAQASHWTDDNGTLRLTADWAVEFTIQ